MVPRSRAQPRHGPRFGRARWSIKTLRATAAARAVIAALFLVGAGIAAWWAAAERAHPTWLGWSPRRTGATTAILAGILALCGLFETWRAWSLWREARQRGKQP